MVKDKPFDAIKISIFKRELNRLREVITTPLNEPILPDDYPVYQGNLYVANGRIVEFIDGMNMTVGKWKDLRIPNVTVVTEVRRCDLAGRKLRLRPERDNLHIAGVEKRQKYRKPRNSNKIKKVP